jgi:Mg2+ and Co2+ transporter CorA
MEVRFVTSSGVREHNAPELPALLRGGGGFVWVDVPVWDAEAESVLTEVFKLHPLVIEACRRRNHVPTVHGYDDHFFVTVHTPLAGHAGMCTCWSWTRWSGTRSW